MTANSLKGVLAPVITPFHKDLSVDKARLVAHSRWLLSQNAGLALFGTNSEANSQSVEERVADPRLKVYLYHIPPVAQVPITLPLVERLMKAYPKAIVGMKDSSGDWPYTQSVLTNFPGLDMFVGSEAFLLAGMRGGGVGCISATANVNPAAIHDLYANWQAADADDRQARLTATRAAIQAFPMIPAL